LIYFAIRLTPIVITYISFKRPKRIILISFQNLELLLGRSSSPVGYGIGIAEVVGSNPTRSTFSCVVMVKKEEQAVIPATAAVLNNGPQIAVLADQVEELKETVNILTSQIQMLRYDVNKKKMHCE
jgi:hypothetical protein